MATIKSYSDFQQSKVLSKILSDDSADMRYHTISHYELYPCDEIVYTVEFGKASGKDIPCWSLAALLNVLPEPELTQGSDRRWMLRIWDKKRLPLTIGGHVDPVEACYDMILKLHKKKIL